MACNRTDRIISWSRWLALVACLLIVPLAAFAAAPGRKAELARAAGTTAPVPFVDNDGDGVPVPFDCDDTLGTGANVYPAYLGNPAAPEICDFGRDNDCDGLSDNNVAYTTPGTSCTVGAGGCAGSPGQYVCTGDFTSACDGVPQPDGAACNDGDMCTGPDFCTSGVCGAGALITVSSNNMNGWAFNVDSPDGTGTFVTGPATPPLGLGSARLETGTNGDWSAQIRNVDYNGTKLSDLTALRYSTYATSWNGQQLPYLSLEVDLDNDGVLDDRLFFEPGYQTPTSGNPALPNQGAEQLATWQTWNAFVGGWWSNGGAVGDSPGTGVKPLSDWIAAFPQARMRNKLDGLGAIRLLVGYASNTDVFDGNVDAFAIGVSGVVKTYNFETTDICSDNNDCTTDTCSANACVWTNKTMGAACGDSNNAACNAPDTCDGAGMCVDRKKVINSVCLAGTLPCDPDDVCDGSTNVCAPLYASSGTACGSNDNSACNAPDGCDGGGLCIDRKKTSGAVCLPGTLPCDPDDTCDGTTNSCAVIHATNGMACDDGDKCTGTDYCSNGVCAGPTLITVSPNNLYGWHFHDDTTEGPGTGTIVAGPGLPPLGTGSVRLALTSATDRQIVATYAHGGTRLADVTRLEYSTYRSSVDAGNNLALTLQFDVDYDLNDNLPWAPAGGNPTGRRFQGRLVFEPNISSGGGTVFQNTWQTWDVGAGKWWSSGGPGAAVCTQASPCTTAQVLSNWPNAGIHANIASATCVSGCGVPGRLLVKAGGPGPAGFDGNADALIIEVGGATPSRTTYDFDDTPICTDGNDCTIDTCVADTCVFTDRPDATTVAPGNLNGWAAISRRTAAAAFLAGPPPPPLGAGSYVMATGPGGGGPALPGGDSAGLGGKTWLSTEQFNGTLLSAITAIGYSTYIQASPGGNTINVAINMYVDLDGNGTRDTTLVYEPVYDYGNPTPGVWQTWDAYNGGTAKWWYTANFGVLGNAFNDFLPLSYYIAQFPNAKVITWYSAGDPVRSDGWGMNLVAGQNSAGPPWNSFVGYVDKFTFSTSAPSSYTADLEPTALCNDGNACTVDQCGSGACSNPSSSAGTACGDNTTTTCDGANTCNGSGACDPRYAPVTTECRGSAGICDLADFCDGSGACSPDAKSTAECRASGGVCDVADFCDGASNDCPADQKVPAATECRAAAGVCDAAESCDGTTNSCPPDLFEPATTLCVGGANGDLCDLDAADHCLGTANTCVDAYQPNTHECRADAGQCDVRENCTASASACPPNGFEPSGTACTDNNVCTSSNGSPTTADQCDGSGDCDGNAVTCASDGNVCTDDVCHGPTTGCTNDPVCGISGTVVYNKVVPILYRCNAGPQIGQPCTTNTFCGAPNQCVAGTDAADPANPVGDATMTLTGAASGSTLTDNDDVPAPPAGTYSFSNVAGMITDTPTRSATANDVLSGLDSSDSSLISKRSVGLVGPFTPRMFKAGDVSTNGVLTAFDAALVSQRALNIITSWPAPSTLGSTMWFFDPVSLNLNVNFTPGPNNADFVGIMYGDVSMSWSGPANPFADARNLPERWLALDPVAIQRIAAAPGATSTIYISQAPAPKPDGSYEMVLGMTTADGVMGLDLDLNYDPSIVTIESLTPIGLSDLFAIDSNVVSNGVKRVAMFCPAPMEGTGDFLVVKMRFNGALGGLPFELTGSANEGAIDLEWLSPSNGNTQGPGGPGQPGQNDSSSKGGN